MINAIWKVTIVIKFIGTNTKAFNIKYKAIAIRFANINFNKYSTYIDLYLSIIYFTSPYIPKVNTYSIYWALLPIAINDNITDPT